MVFYKKIAASFRAMLAAREERKEMHAAAEINSRLHFIEGELSQLLSKIDTTITVAEYMRRGTAEYVRVHYDSGSYYDVNVTADSLGVMALEVIERII